MLFILKSVDFAKSTTYIFLINQTYTHILRGCLEHRWADVKARLRLVGHVPEKVHDGKEHKEERQNRHRGLTIMNPDGVEVHKHKHRNHKGDPESSDEVVWAVDKVSNSNQSNTDNKEHATNHVLPGASASAVTSLGRVRNEKNGDKDDDSEDERVGNPARDSCPRVHLGVMVINDPPDDGENDDRGKEENPSSTISEHPGKNVRTTAATRWKASWGRIASAARKAWKINGLRRHLLYVFENLFY